VRAPLRRLRRLQCATTSAASEHLARTWRRFSFASSVCLRAAQVDA
jgi:hypothetical protein